MEGDIFHRSVDNGHIWDVFHYALSKMDTMASFNNLDDDKPLLLNKTLVREVAEPVVQKTTVPATTVKRTESVQPIAVDREPAPIDNRNIYDDGPVTEIAPELIKKPRILIPTTFEQDFVIKRDPTPIEEEPPPVDYHPKPEEEEEIIEQEDISSRLIKDDPDVPFMPVKYIGEPTFFEEIIKEEPVPEPIPEPIPGPEYHILPIEEEEPPPVDYHPKPEEEIITEETPLIDEEIETEMETGEQIFDVDEILEENENYVLDEETGEIIDDETGEVVYSSDGTYVGGGGYVAEETADGTGDGGYIQKLPKGIQITGYVYPYLFLIITIAGGTAGFLIARHFKQSVLSTLALAAAGLMGGSAVMTKIKPPVKV